MSVGSPPHPASCHRHFQGFLFPSHCLSLALPRGPATFPVSLGFLLPTPALSRADEAPNPPAQPWQRLWNWTPHYLSHVCNAYCWSPTGLAPLEQLILWSLGMSLTLHVGDGGERWKSSLPLPYSFTGWLEFVPSSILLSTIKSQVSNNVKSHPLIHSSPPGTGVCWHPPCISAGAAIDGLPSLSPPFPPPALPVMCHTTACSYPHTLAPSCGLFAGNLAPPSIYSISLPLPCGQLSASRSSSTTHLCALPPIQLQPLPSGDDLFVYLESKLSRAGTVSNCVFVPYLQLRWTEYTHCHLLLETKFLLGLSSTEKQDHLDIQVAGGTCWSSLVALRLDHRQILSVTAIIIQPNFHHRADKERLRSAWHGGTPNWLGLRICPNSTASHWGSVWGPQWCQPCADHCVAVIATGRWRLQARCCRLNSVLSPTTQKIFVY